MKRGKRRCCWRGRRAGQRAACPAGRREPPSSTWSPSATQYSAPRRGSPTAGVRWSAEWVSHLSSRRPSCTLQCQIDVLNWFEHDPARDEEQSRDIQECFEIFCKLDFLRFKWKLKLSEFKSDQSQLRLELCHTKLCCGVQLHLELQREDNTTRTERQNSASGS